MSSNVSKGIFGQPVPNDEDQAALFKAQRELAEQRVVRGKVINGILSTVAICFMLLVVIGAVCAAAWLIRSTF